MHPVTQGQDLTLPADKARARAGLERSLGRGATLARLMEQGGDARLDSILDNINRRETAQANRLQKWLFGIPDSVDALPEQSNASGPANAVVLERHNPTPDLVIFKTSRPPGLVLHPGQSVKLGLDGVRRRYSVVSAPHEPFLEFFVELIPGGAMSGRLENLREGDSVSVGSPKGKLLLNTQKPNHLMVATVTGINPFVSMVRHSLHQSSGNLRFVVLQGASYADEFGYYDELGALAAAHPDVLSFIPTVSRPDESRNAGWQGHRGRVGTLVEEYLDQAGWDAAFTCIYACGHSQMVSEVASTARSRDFEARTETYD